MKKLVISIAAISTAMAAGVHAETFSGEVDIAYGKSTTENAESALGFDVVKLGVNPTFTGDNGVTTFASFEVGFAEATEADAQLSLNEAFVGLAVSGAELTVGKQGLASDDFGIGKDVSFGVDGQLGASAGSDVIKASYDLGGLKVIAATDISESDDESAVDVYGAYSLENITVAATFQSHKADANTDATSYVGVSGEYTMDAISVAGEFTYDVDMKDMAYEVAGSYDVSDSVTIAAGVGQTIYDNDSMDTLTQYYVNSELALNSNATAYAEVGSNNSDNSELGYVVGMKVKF